VLLPYGPERLYDSRLASGALASGNTRTLSGDPIPEDLAYLLNVTLTDVTGAVWLSVYPADQAWPGTSTVNWFGAGSVANTAYTWLRASDRGITIRVGGTGSTQFVIDLTGVLTLIDLGAVAASQLSVPAGNPSKALREASS
jgi:hypothetical protein